MPRAKPPGPSVASPGTRRAVEVKPEHYLSMFVAERDEGGYKVSSEIMADPELLLAWARKHEPGSVFSDQAALINAMRGGYGCYLPPAPRVPT